METLAWILLATIANSLVALAGAVTLGWSKKTLNSILHALVGFSAGALLGGAFFHLIAESLEEMPTIEILKSRSSRSKDNSESVRFVGIKSLIMFKICALSSGGSTSVL